MRILIAAGLLAISGAAHAATFTVNSTADVARSGGARACQCNAPLQPCTLRAAVQASNTCVGADTITLAAAATYALASGTSEDYAVSGDLDLRDPVTILGNGATVDARYLDRAFELGRPSAGGDYVIRDLRVVHGIHDGGGFRLWSTGAGTLLSNVTIEDGTDAGAVGGGVLVTGGTLTIEGSELSHLTYACGGAIAIDGATVSITGSDFEFNRAASCVGGAIDVITASTLAITSSRFFANTAFYRGGAIALWAGLNHVSIDDSTFESNQADGNSFHGGGAIYCVDTVLTISSSAFTSNSVPAEGGALTLENTYATLTEIDAAGNHSDNGGFAMVNYNSVLLVSKSSLRDNTATTGGAGGAINVVDGRLSLFDSELAHNNGSGAALALGGDAEITDVRITDSPQDAVTIGPGAHVHIDRTSIGHGGATAIVTSGNLELTNSTVFSNADGGLWVMDGDTSINNSTIVDNSAYQGGGLDITGGTTEIGNTIVARNSAWNSGDDIYGAYTDLGHNVIALAPRLDPVTDVSPLPAYYGLDATSPARNTGDNATCEAVDITRTARPLGGTCDIGARERP